MSIIFLLCAGIFVAYHCHAETTFPINSTAVKTFTTCSDRPLPEDLPLTSSSARELSVTIVFDDSRSWSYCAQLHEGLPIAEVRITVTDKCQCEQDDGAEDEEDENEDVKAEAQTWEDEEGVGNAVTLNSSSTCIIIALMIAAVFFYEHP